MKIEKARRISTSTRNGMTADALVLVYDASARLGKGAVIDAIAAVLDSIGDPLEKLWVEDRSARRRTYEIAQLAPVLGDQAGFRYLWAIPRSERRNSKSRWLTAAMIDNVAVDSSVLFFALPRGVAPEFVPHRTLLELLAQAGIIPQYGYGARCRYDKPDYFAFDYAYNNRVPAIAHADWARLCALSNDRTDTPSPRSDGYRQVRAPILDVFPLNVLSDVHLRQKVGGISFREWIVRNTGSSSLTQIGPGCFAWYVPDSQTTLFSAQLKAFGLTLDRSRQSAASPEPVPPGSALRSAPATVYATPARYDPAPTRFHTRMAQTDHQPLLPPRREGAPAAIERASLVSLSRRSGSH